MHALTIGLDADKFATFWMFLKGFITHLFCKWPLHTPEAAEHKYTCTILKHMKTYKSG